MAHRHERLPVSRWCLCVTILLAACGGPGTAPSPPPDPHLQVTPLDSSRSVRISFVSANITPGSVVAGCGGLIEGCAGRLRMTFRLDPPSDGPVLYARVYLHATNLIACLCGRDGAVHGASAACQPSWSIPLDRADRCGIPNTMATLAVVVEGPSQVESRQTWSLYYRICSVERPADAAGEHIRRDRRRISGSAGEILAVGRFRACTRGRHDQIGVGRRTSTRRRRKILL